MSSILLATTNVFGSSVGVGGIESDINVSGQRYRVHVFTSSGTFSVPNGNLSDVEYLVIAGGGGGGGGFYQHAAGGGSGAGGYRSSISGENSGGGSTAESKLSLSDGSSYAVTIGAGAAGGTGTSTAHTNGGNTTFHTITSLGGGRGGKWNGTTGQPTADRPT